MLGNINISSGELRGNLQQLPHLVGEVGVQETCQKTFLWRLRPQRLSLGSAMEIVNCWVAELYNLVQPLDLARRRSNHTLENGKSPANLEFVVDWEVFLNGSLNYVVQCHSHCRETIKHQAWIQTARFLPPSLIVIQSGYNHAGWWFQPLWKIWKSIGMISNPIYGKIKLMATKPPTSWVFVRIHWYFTQHLDDAWIMIRGRPPK